MFKTKVISRHPLEIDNMDFIKYLRVLEGKMEYLIDPNCAECNIFLIEITPKT